MSNNVEHDFLVKLINVVKEHPQLYDYEKYSPSNREVQNECAEIWNNISKEMGESRELCKKKWQVVRGCYQRYLRQIDIAKAPYYLSSHLEFLFPLYSNKFKPEPEILENVFEDDDDDDDDYVEMDQFGNKSDDDEDANKSDNEEDWLENNILKNEITQENEVEQVNETQPFESISVEEKRPVSKKSLIRKLPDTKYFNDMPLAVKLLNHIKKYPELYTIEGRPVSDSTPVWEKISKDLGETPDNCKRKWRMYRSSHQRYLKNIDTAPTPYYLTEHMKFLLPYYGNKYLPKSHRYIVKEYMEKMENSGHENSVEDNDSNLEEINFIDINKNKRKPNIDVDNLKTITEIKRIKIEDLEENENFEDKRDIEDDEDFQEKRDFEDNGDLIFLKSLLPDLKLLDTNKKITFRISVLNLVKELLDKKDCIK